MGDKSTPTSKPSKPEKSIDRPPDDNDYEPHSERETKNQTNDIESMLHIVKGILGTGILAMPEAFRNAGFALGFAGCVVNGFLLSYGIHVYIHSTYVLCKRNRVPLLTYPAAMALGFSQGPHTATKCSKAAGVIVDGFIIFYQIGVCCVYVLFVVVNVKSVCDLYLIEDLPIQTYTLMLLIPCLLLNSMRNLKVLVPFSFIANGITLLTTGVVFYYIFSTPLPPITDRKLVGKLSRFPLFFGTTCFAFQSVAVVIAVENNMKKPSHFGGYFGIYNIAVFSLVLLYMCLGFFGYWKFGEETAPSVTLNFPPTAILTQVINSMYAFAIFTSFGLNGQIPLQLVWDTYMSRRLEDSHYRIAWEYVIRFATVVLSLFFAASIPMIGLFMSVLGAITVAHLGFVFPGLLDLCVRYPDNYGAGNIYKIRDIFFIIYGYFGMLTSCYVGIKEMALEFIRKEAERA